MLPYHVLAVSKDHVSAGEGIVVSTIHNKSDRLVLVGSSVPVSLPVGVHAEHLVVHPDRAGVLFLNVRLTDSRGKFLDWSVMPLGISVDSEGKFFIADDKIWIPPGGRIGQGVGNFNIRVVIDGEAYSSSPFSEGASYVPDPNLLCRYLMGDVTADEVKTAVQVYERTRAEQVERERRNEENEQVVEVLRPLLQAIPFQGGKDQAALEERARALRSYVEMVFQPTFLHLEDRGLIEPSLCGDFHTIRPTALVRSATKRISALANLAVEIRNAYSGGRWGLYGRMTKVYDQYREDAREASVHYAPEKR